MSTIELPNEILEKILFGLWAEPLTLADRQNFLTSYSLVDSRWWATVERISTRDMYVLTPDHAVFLLEKLSNHDITNMNYCRSLTLTIIHPASLLRHLLDKGCQTETRSVILARRFLQYISDIPETALPNLSRITIDHIDDSLCHVPNYPIPKQVKHLQIQYRFRPSIPDTFCELRAKRPTECHCSEFALNTSITNLSIFGSYDQHVWAIASCFTLQELTVDFPITPPQTLSRTKIQSYREILLQEPFLPGSFPYELICARSGSDCIVSYSSLNPLMTFTSVLCQQQVEVGAVGYLDPTRGRFVELFNSTRINEVKDERIKNLPPISDGPVLSYWTDRYHEWDLDRRPERLADEGDPFVQFYYWLRPHRRPDPSYHDLHSIELSHSSDFAFMLFGGVSQYTYLQRPDWGEWIPDFSYNELARLWFHDHIDTIYEVYGRKLGLRRSELFLVLRTCDVGQYAFFACNGSEDNVPLSPALKLRFRLFLHHEEGQPFGIFHLEPENDKLQWWSYVTPKGGLKHTLTIKCVSVKDR